MSIKVKKSDSPESTEILAESIIKIGDAMDSLSRSSGLNKRAIITLIQAETKLSRTAITTVLDALPRLRGWYCRKEK